MSHPKQDDAPDTALYLRTELLERIAHELRGPAGVALGALDEIEHALSEAEDESQRALLSMVRRGARRILRTADRLTRTAQLEAGSAHMAATPHDVRALVERAASDAQQIEGRSSIRVDVRACAEPCMARLDASWLNAALAELFSQSIRCAQRDVQIEVLQSGDHVSIMVSDDRTSLMETPHTRFTALRDRRDCALGWPLAYDVARAHGGNLTLEPLPATDGARPRGARATLSLRAH